MNFLRSRSEQLADYLRSCITRNELTDPLPGTRTWCKTLGVSHTSLKIALRMLRREGLLIIHPRKSIRLARAASRAKSRGKAIRLRSQQRSASSPDGHFHPMVRYLYYGREYSESSFFELPPLVELLHSKGIELSLERCTHARLKAIGREPLPSHEMLLLSSLPAAHHRYFAHMKGNVLVCGHPSPGSPLSYVTLDDESAIRHAAQSLLRRGFSKISLIIDKGTPPGVLQIISAFHKTCADWPHQPVLAETLRFELDPDAMRSSARHFAARVKARQGVLVCQPVSVTMVMTALMERNIEIHRDVELIALNTPPNSIHVCPKLVHYPFPLKATVKHYADAAVRFFETGTLPRIQKKLPLEAVPATP